MSYGTDTGRDMAESVIDQIRVTSDDPEIKWEIVDTLIEQLESYQRRIPRRPAIPRHTDSKG